MTEELNLIEGSEERMEKLEEAIKELSKGFLDSGKAQEMLRGISQKFQRRSDLKHIVEVCRFYNNELEALKVFASRIDLLHANEFSPASFYGKEKAVYEKRLKNGISKDVRLLRYHLNSIFEEEHAVSGNPSGGAFLASHIKYHGDSINGHQHDY